MSWLTLQPDGALLHGRDEGAGLPVVFQHGLGGDEAQVAEIFPDGDRFRRLTLECRAHGCSSAGKPGDLSIASFAEDVLAFADLRGVDRFVVGGISMGAAIALRIAICHPERVSGLILGRPAWLWQDAPANMRPFAEVALHLRDPDAQRGLADFDASATARGLARDAPDNLASLRNFFAAKDRATLALLLAAVSRDGPGVSEADVRSIAVPALVIGNRIDAVHPLEFAETLAAAIEAARLIEITPKATDRTRYVAEFRAELSAFLGGLAKPEGSSS